MAAKRPPYLALTLDAKKKVPPTAKAAGVEPGLIIWGLLEMWEHVRLTKRDTLSVLALEGFFGADERRRAALVEFDWLEAIEDGRYRVRGAKDHLNVAGDASEAASKAGKASAASGKSLANLKQNAKSRSDAVRSSVRSEGPGFAEFTERTERTPNASPNDHRTDSERPPNHTHHPTPNTYSKTSSSEPAQLALVEQQVRDTPEDLQRLWNEHAHPSLSRWKAMPKARRKAAEAALERRPIEGPEGWRAVLERLNASDYLRGMTGGDWRADPDWWIRPDGQKGESAALVLEGKYDNRGPSRAPAPAATPCAVPGCDQSGGLEQSEGRRLCVSHDTNLAGWWHRQAFPDGRYWQPEDWDAFLADLETRRAS